MIHLIAFYVLLALLVLVGLFMLLVAVAGIISLFYDKKAKAGEGCGIWIMLGLVLVDAGLLYLITK